MTIRERLEQEERQRLSPLAVCSADSKGRERPMEKCPLRTEFQRDRDRIIHCKSFRRLKHKTQVFLAPEGDHYRTRLTHTLEVAQIARTIARALRLNEDLTEASALGHDLGHTPFGHQGERVLNELCPSGFEHNKHSLRIVERLEGGCGLNLTFEVRDGVVNHRTRCKPSTMEGRAVRISDKIAYINHDIDDALRAKLFTPDELPASCHRVLGETSGQRIHVMISNIVENGLDGGVIEMTGEVKAAADELKVFLSENVYRASSLAKKEEQKAGMLIETLYGYFKKNPSLLPDECRGTIENEGIDQAVTDYIASMTDNYVVNVFRGLFIPERWMY